MEKTQAGKADVDRHMILRLLLPMLVACLALLSCRTAPETTKQPATPAPAATAPSSDEPLQGDPSLVQGTLANGLTYYIHKNSEPRGRAELRLVVKAGSILEDPDQIGLAHFTEHMAFNGTEHFQKNTLVDFLESVGMRFGPDVNASTGFDETLYMLQLPTDQTATLETGIQILEDWAHRMTFNPKEIDKERGVVIEEWRSRRGAEARIQDKHLPVLFQDSRYAERIPIGDPELIAHFDPKVLKRFYADWYRPDLMAVVAVGDFDVSWMEQQIRTHFDRIPARENPRPREQFTVPDHPGTRFSIATDPEASLSSLAIHTILPALKEKTVGDYRKRMAEYLYNAMLNERLDEASRKSSPPFVRASSRKRTMTADRELYTISAVVKDNGVAQGLEALLTETDRVMQYGFTPTELEREKKALMRAIEQLYKERNTIPSSQIASDCIDAFRYGVPVLTIDTEYALYQRLMPEITLKEVNAFAAQWNTDDNRVVLVASPQKKGIHVPGERELQSLMAEMAHRPVAPYVDQATCGPLCDVHLKGCSVVSEKQIPEIGVTEWTMANGVHVILKPTDFQRDEVRFTAFSPGGTSLVATDDLVAAKTAPGIVMEAGVGQYNQVQLEKLLADKAVSVSPYIGNLTEGLSGSAATEDFETMLQLVYLYFTAPRSDPTAFSAYKARVQSQCADRERSPEAAFRDAIVSTLTQHNPRFSPLTADKLGKMQLDKSLEIYRSRFADAGDFTFIFVGNFDPKRIRPLIENYLGGLPTLGRKESWQDTPCDYATGVVEKSVEKGMEPVSLNSIIFSGPFHWDRQNRFALDALSDVLSIKLRERIREDLGGTYGVSVESSFSHYPKERYQVNISFGCAPDRVQELTAATFAEIEKLKSAAADAETVAKVKEINRREYEVNLRDNGFWLDNLELAAFHGEDPRNILHYGELIDALSPEEIQQSAQQYLNSDNYVKVVLYPEHWKAAAKTAAR